MNMKYLSTIICCAAVIAAGITFSACKSTAVDLSNCERVLVDDNNNQDVTVHKNKMLCVKLKAQLGTGYGWSVAGTADILSLQGQPDTEPAAKNLPGGAEHQVFRFSAVKAGSGNLELHYIRPWLKNEPPAKKFKVKVTVVE